MRDDAALGVTGEPSIAIRPAFQSIFIVLIVLAPIVTVAAIWAAPLYNFNPIVRVSTPKDFPGGVDWKSAPSLDKLTFVSPGTFLPRESGDELIALARTILEEKFPVGGNNAQMLRLPFDETAVFAGNSYWQLRYSGFMVPAILNRAYRKIGDERYLAAARDFILGWEAFESGRWLPKGLVWNDHAIATRAVILAEFWHLYRRSALFKPDEAQNIVRLAARTAALLANERLYTYKSNHGMVQNVGLLKLTIFFPEFESITRYRDMAVERTLAQTKHYLGEEGVIREHSIGYHAYGLWLVQGVEKLLAHLGRRLPNDYLRRLRKGEEFIALAQRPDGTVPRSGDTKTNRVLDLRGMGLDAPPPHAVPESDNERSRGTVKVYPKSGYAIRWHAARTVHQATESLSQLMAVWGHFPHRKHKQADDLSLHLWADGIDWWTSVGYWPYSRGDRGQALDWAGSNAPHRVGEPAIAFHRPRADYIGAQDDTLFLELTRGSPDSFRANRQVLALPEQVWVIVDTYEDQREGTARTVWLTDSKNEIETLNSDNQGGYRITSRRTSDRLAVSVIGSTPPTLRVAKGETDPFVGWIARRPPEPAPALVVETPLPASWTANVAVLEHEGTPRLTEGVRMTDWISARQWTLAVPLRGGRLEIRRDKSAIAIRRGDKAKYTTIALRGVTDDEQSYAPDLAAYRKQQKLYTGRLEPVEAYRIRMTWLVLGLGIASLAFIYLVCRLSSFRARPFALGLPVASWIGLNLWLHLVYF